MEAYDGPQIVGMDLHRRRSVLVRMTEDGQKTLHIMSVLPLQLEALFDFAPLFSCIAAQLKTFGDGIQHSAKFVGAEHPTGRDMDQVAEVAVRRIADKH